MASPMRLNAALIAAAEREAAIQKRSIPKQIEFWAELGKAVEHMIGMEDVIAITQGLKRIELEDLASSPVNPDDIFEALEQQRSNGNLSQIVSEAPVYYESSPTHPGYLDRVDTIRGTRETGRFVNGSFTVLS
jgi:hypothetical protein